VVSLFAGMVAVVTAITVGASSRGAAFAEAPAPPAGDVGNEAAATQRIRTLMESQVNDAFRASGRPAHRDAHAKAQGCVKARFSVLAATPPRLRRGLFARPATYTAWIRFSNAVGTDDRVGLARGMAIKLTGVPGSKILPAESTETTADLLLVNYPVFNVKTASDYVDFFEASRDGKLAAFFARHPHAGKITAALAAQYVSNPLLQRYFSMTPYALGLLFVKYSAQPVSCTTGKRLHDPASGSHPPGPNYLRAAMVKTLAAGPSCFTFGVQRQSDPQAMPVEDATVLWDEAVSPFVPVASIVIPKQRFESVAQQMFCENLSYTPWHALPDNRPVGNINRIRRVVYDAISKLRHRLNNIARGEPTGNERFEGSPAW